MLTNRSLAAELGQILNLLGEMDKNSYKIGSLMERIWRDSALLLTTLHSILRVGDKRSPIEIMRRLASIRSIGQDQNYKARS